MHYYLILYFPWVFQLLLIPDATVAGGPSGSGKTSLAHKMANIVGCEVISLESYYKSEQVKDFKYDDFSTLDLSLLSKVEIRVFSAFVQNAHFIAIYPLKQPEICSLFCEAHILLSFLKCIFQRLNK